LVQHDCEFVGEEQNTAQVTTYKVKKAINSLESNSFTSKNFPTDRY